MPTRILVVDDEPSLRSLLSRVLIREGFGVLLAPNGIEGLAMVESEKPDAVILDLNLPDLSGEDVCLKIRQNLATANLPVLILTGKDAEALSIRCLDGGADDYLSKPFDIEELLAHVRALLRRSRGHAANRETISNGSLTIHVAEHSVFWKGRRLPALAPKEFEILHHLVMQAPRVLDKKTLAFKVWGIAHDQLHQRTLDVHVRRIRGKLGPAAAACLSTVPAVGFQWLEESALPAPTLDPSSAR